MTAPAPNLFAATTVAPAGGPFAPASVAAVGFEALLAALFGAPEGEPDTATPQPRSQTTQFPTQARDEGEPLIVAPLEPVSDEAPDSDPLAPVQLAVVPVTQPASISAPADPTTTEAAPTARRPDAPPPSATRPEPASQAPREALTNGAQGRTDEADLPQRSEPVAAPSTKADAAVARVMTPPSIHQPQAPTPPAATPRPDAQPAPQAQPAPAQTLVAEIAPPPAAGPNATPRPASVGPPPPPSTTTAATTPAPRVASKSEPRKPSTESVSPAPLQQEAAPHPSAKLATGPALEPSAPDAEAVSPELQQAKGDQAESAPADLRAAHTLQKNEAQPAPVRAGPETVAMLAAQVVRKLEGRASRFELELAPAGLGRVDVRIEIAAHGRVTAVMTFDNPQAAAELRGRSAELQRSLEQAGFDLSDGIAFDVAGERGQTRQDQRGQTDNHAFRGHAFQAALDNAGEADLAAQAATLHLRRGVTAGVDLRI